MTGARWAGALSLAALALAAAPAPASAFTGGGPTAPAPAPGFGAAATCLQEVAVVPALGSHAAGPSACAHGSLLDHAVGTVGSLTA
ncbi:hypothetical protein ACFCX4_02405 [Kitasatospora sp. NPDC056327]|uniref:hypothetical protein n=1 Tax=Kitasatospora sp. NPDC056327 TaxID=3345785 RepID=UPI0035E02442